MASSSPKGIGKPIDLRDTERGLTILFDERLAYDLEPIEARLRIDGDVDRQARLTDISLRKQLAWTIIAITFLLNIFVVIFLWHLASNDRDLIERAFNSRPEQSLELAKWNIRLVTPQVLMSLVGATTVQVGTALIVITRYLFPKQSAK